MSLVHIAHGRSRASSATELLGSALDVNPLVRAVVRARDGGCVTGDDRILVWNRAAERMLGYTASEAIGRSCCEVFAGHDDRGNRICYHGCQVSMLTRMGEPVRCFDMQSTTKDGRPIWLNVSILAAPAGRDHGPLLVHLFRDVTATREALARVGANAVPATGAEPAETPEGLTPRELEVLRVMATGAGTKVCAERLRVSRATIRNHAQNILMKLGVHSRLEAVAFARQHHLL